MERVYFTIPKPERGLAVLEESIEGNRH